jgi:flagella basal body P-ring formation protein FlgA
MKWLMIAFLFIFVPTAFAQSQTLRLRDTVTVRGATITLADLIEGVPDGPALFMAPAPGATGTIRAARIKEAALQAGLADIDWRALPHVAVTRSARALDLANITEEVRTELSVKLGIAPAGLDVMFDTAPDLATLLLPHDGPLIADVMIDQSARRFTVTFDPARPQRERPLLTGRFREMVEIAVLRRPLARGETVTADHIAVEKRPRGEVPDAAGHAGILGLVAKNAIAAGQAVRQHDLGKPILIERNSLVTLTFQTPGMELQLRGRAQDQGALGEAITILNPVSKKTVVGVVTGPGRALVNPEQQDKKP